MWRDIKIPFFTVIFIFLGFFLFTKVFGPIPFSVNTVTTTKENLFTATGEGEVSAIPDTALISLGVSKTAPTVASAQQQVNTIINRITADLKSLGVKEKDIKTVNYSVNPNYDYDSGRQQINGYVVDADIEVKLKPIDKANEAIDQATKDGATNIGSIQFILDEQKQKEIEEKARKEAIRNAKEKAQSIANAAGVRLGRIVDVQESGDDYQPFPYRMAGDLKATTEDAPATKLNPGENKITITVTLSYETY